MARAKTYFLQRRSKKCGNVVVHVTPLAFHSACGEHQPVAVRVTQDRQTIWNPKRPLCVQPRYKIGTTRGRAHAADSAVRFLQKARCGKSRRLD